MADVYRPIPLIRWGGALVGVIVALPSLAGLVIALAQGMLGVNLLFALALGVGGLVLGLRWWRLSAELDESRLHLRGPFRTRVFDLRSVSGVEDVVKWGAESPSRNLVLVGTQGERLAGVSWLRILRGHEELIRRIRARGGSAGLPARTEPDAVANGRTDPGPF